MISITLKNRPLHDIEWTNESMWFDRKAKAMIDVQVRRLVMLMRSIELDGKMGWLNIEDAVLDAFEKAERLYYGMSEEDFAALVEREVVNEEARRRSKDNL